MLALGFALALVIGLSLGLLGGGGSILTVPIFVYVLGFPAKQAIAMSLPVVGATSLFGALSHWRAGNVQPRTAVLFGVVAMAGSYTGARMSGLLSGAAQLTLLAVVMLAAAVSMLRSAAGRGPAAAAAAEMPVPSPALLLPVGLGVGLLTGLVGIGGGFLIVPALVLLARVPMRQAVGTSLLVIAMNAASGSVGYLGREELPWEFMAGFAAIAVVGIVAGSRLVHRVPQAQLKRAFAVFLVLVGALILFQNRRTILPEPASAAPAVQE